jgi:hypothetical protein
MLTELVSKRPSFRARDARQSLLSVTIAITLSLSGGASSEAGTPQRALISSWTFRPGCHSRWSRERSRRPSDLPLLQNFPHSAHVLPFDLLTRDFGIPLAGGDLTMPQEVPNGDDLSPVLQ